MDWKSFDFFPFGSVCSCLLTYLHARHIVRVEKEINALQFWVSFFLNRWVLTVLLCLLTMFDFGEFVHLDTSFLRYCTYSSDDVQFSRLLMMMMIHNSLDLTRGARTLWFMVHGSILLYRNYVHITCTSLSNHALLFVITYCYESLVHCVSLLLG